MLIYDVTAFQAVNTFTFPYGSASSSAAGTTSVYTYSASIPAKAFFVGEYAYYGSNPAGDPIDFDMYSSGTTVQFSINDLTTSSQVLYGTYIILQTQVSCPAPTAWVTADNQC